MLKKMLRFMALKDRIMESNVLIEDFNNVLNSELDIDKFKNQHFFITGATGLIGSLLVKFLIYANKVKNLDIEIYAMIRNINKAKKIYQDYDLSNVHFVIAHLGQNDLECDAQIDYIIHTSAVTQSKLMIEDPVGTIRTSVNGTEEVLKFAVSKGIKSMVYVSSMEVYGEINSKEKVKEDDLGFIDLTSSRSCYSESKRMCELLCTAYSDEYNIHVTIARLAQTFGAGILPTENRVFAQFAKSICNRRNIILHTAGRSEGNYVYTADAIKGLLFLLLKGTIKEAYNVSNEENHMTIKEMANLVINDFGSANERVIINIPKEDMGYAPDVRMWLSNKKIQDLGWRPTQDMFHSYQRMIKWMREKNIS